MLVGSDKIMEGCYSQQSCKSIGDQIAWLTRVKDAVKSFEIVLRRLSTSSRLALGTMWFCLALAALKATEITKKNLRFVDYPDFPEAHSTWGSIGFSSKHNKVFIGVTNHRDRVGLFEYDVTSSRMSLGGFIPQLAHLRDYQWQGKIHSQIVEGPDGCMYFTTDGGESREEYLMEHPHGYSGGFFMKWHPVANRLTNLGVGLQYESIKDLAVDPVDGKIYAVSYPQVIFLFTI
jgi:hypothetical protein